MTPDEIKKIYASAPVGRTTLEVISFSASWFSKTYYLQRQFTEDIEVVLENDTVVDVLYAPMSVEQASSNADLNYERNVVIQMVNDIIASENDNYDPEVHGSEMPLFQSRGYIAYRDGTISSIQYGPITLPVRKMKTNNQGSVINVTTKPSNESSTGEIATVTRVQTCAHMIGTHYHVDNFNCANFVASWYHDKLNIEIPVTDVFELSFLRWMRKHFIEIDKPENDCLVRMESKGATHIGVYADNGVYHNYKVGKVKGSVVHWTLGVVNRNYNKVTFWKWSK